MNIAITGTRGFIGSVLFPTLSQHYQTRPITRAEFGDFLLTTDCTAALTHVEVVIHLAACSHIMHNNTKDPLTEFRSTNTTATFNLARQAAAAGVKRFIFISSIKVNGEVTKPRDSFTASDVCVPPYDPYAVSKYEAEQGLEDISKQTSMEIVIIRPPLVYGPGVKGNFLSMMRWLHKGIPLPLGAVHNQRSLVALDNIIDLITVCIDHPAAANQTFLVSDGEDLSTTELLQRLGAALGRPVRLLPVPASWLRKAASLLGKEDIAMRLLGSLQIDMRKTCELLNWSPPISVDEALRKTAKAYLQAH